MTSVPQSNKDNKNTRNTWFYNKRKMRKILCLGPPSPQSCVDGETRAWAWRDAHTPMANWTLVCFSRQDWTASGSPARCYFSLVYTLMFSSAPIRDSISNVLVQYPPSLLFVPPEMLCLYRSSRPRCHWNSLPLCLILPSSNQGLANCSLQKPTKKPKTNQQQ